MQDGLGDYSNTVDNQNTINNYASSIENLTLKLNTTDCLQWQNALQECDFSDLIQSINCCKQKNLSSDDLNTLFKMPVAKKTVGFFKSARDELEAQNIKKFGNKNGNHNQQNTNNSVPKRSLGAKRGIQSKFVPPIKNDSSKYNDKDSQESWEDDEVVDERLKNIDPRMVELIRAEIMDSSAPISWDDIAGLEFAKTIIKEVVVWPLLRPDIFTGLRRPPKGNNIF